MTRRKRSSSRLPGLAMLSLASCTYCALSSPLALSKWASNDVRSVSTAPASSMLLSSFSQSSRSPHTMHGAGTSNQGSSRNITSPLEILLVAKAVIPMSASFLTSKGPVSQPVDEHSLAHGQPPSLQSSERVSLAVFCNCEYLSLNAVNCVSKLRKAEPASGNTTGGATQCTSVLGGPSSGAESAVNLVASLATGPSTEATSSTAWMGSWLTTLGGTSRQEV
mmetsp:Transcript_54212/g.100182  ORF Transcript_54212/g.100182 Transcript_54212/m.100182 type:complete len:222 (-) Transcript_54212:298-963(-)